MNNTKSPLSEFLSHHFRHFNAAALLDAAKDYKYLVDNGGKMMVTLAGAMSTAELGISLAEMIRKEKVHSICCTAANLEEDIFNLVAHDNYRRIPDWRNLTPNDEKVLCDEGLNRVTDTCIPEGEAIRIIENVIVKRWKLAEKENRSAAPHEYFWELFEHGLIESCYQIDLKDSWVYAAFRKKIPIFTPGWEDSTLGNIFAANCLKEEIHNVNIIESGIKTMMRLARWYTKEVATCRIGFFQIGGGIAGDFPICVVPLLNSDLKRGIPLWNYFCQISDSTTSYGSYSGAIPREKITWGKLSVDTPAHIIESDATIVAPLIFAYVLGW